MATLGTVQEALLPISAELIWGPLCLSWEDVEFAAVQLCRHFPFPFHKELERHGELIGLFLYPVRGLSISSNGEEPLDLLMRWRYREATDPRDKVYALLGLLTSNALASARYCNYDISPAALFTRVTLDLIRQEKGLRPLLGSAELRHVTPELPTWAIDFACSNRVHGMRQCKWWNHSHRYKQFAACGKVGLPMALWNEGERFSLSGVLVDKILEVNEAFMVDASEAIDDGKLRDAIYGCHELVGRHNGWLTASQGEHEAYIAGGSWSNALWRTMIGDLIMLEAPLRRAQAYDEEDFYAFLEEGDRGRLYESLCGMVVNHAFFITERGYVGFGPTDAQIGDQIWVFYGGQVPFIMKRCVEHSGADDERHELCLIGDVYVHGIMDGQAVQPGSQTRVAFIN